MSTVVVTGSLGTLGAAAVRRLEADGHDVVPLDMRPNSGRTADIRDPESYRALLERADVVVHLASLHGRDHMSRFGFSEFWSTNVDGTLALYRALPHTPVRHVVLACSMAVYGPIPTAPRSKWETRTEDTPTLAYDAYSLTKLTDERIAEYAAATSGVSTTILRFGHFTPCTPLHYAFRLLFGGVDVRDAADAVALAATHPASGVRPLNIHAPSPLIPLTTELADEPVEVLRDLYPDFMNRLSDKGDDARSHLWGRSTWPSDRARASLGYDPAYTFDRFATAYLSGDLSDYANLQAPRWGID
ncbi:NAD-dependent epimerase/dehydratase family protein [Lentzea sp. JNUCC 0626]|uniref:NAD-dependent epimerase/dehydratase family protein n=1 Tax=Lentzea sp. JNUCC 0626 TaxID=3367513 RepID=UPI003748FC23